MARNALPKCDAITAEPHFRALAGPVWETPRRIPCRCRPTLPCMSRRQTRNETQSMCKQEVLTSQSVIGHPCNPSIGWSGRRGDPRRAVMTGGDAVASAQKTRQDAIRSARIGIGAFHPCRSRRRRTDGPVCGGKQCHGDSKKRNEPLIRVLRTGRDGAVSVGGSGCCPDRPRSTRVPVRAGYRAMESSTCRRAASRCRG